MRSKCFLTVALCFFMASFVQAAPLLETNATWAFRKGTNEASVPVGAWRSNNFAATEFGPAPAPFWYGDVLAGGTELVGMSNAYTCIFLRREFVLTNLAEIATLRLGALVDDGLGRKSVV